MAMLGQMVWSALVHAYSVCVCHYAGCAGSGGSQLCVGAGGSGQAAPALTRRLAPVPFFSPVAACPPGRWLAWPQVGSVKHMVSVRQRPHLRTFLERCATLFEVSRCGAPACRAGVEWLQGGGPARAGWARGAGLSHLIFSARRPPARLRFPLAPTLPALPSPLLPLPFPLRSLPALEQAQAYARGTPCLLPPLPLLDSGGGVHRQPARVRGAAAERD